MTTTTTLTRRALLVAGAAGSAAVVFGMLARRGGAGAAPTVNAYVRFDTDGWITLVNPAIEMGQGSSTALAQVLADALDADWRRVRVVPAPYDETYGNPRFGMRLVTADSAATSAYWPVLRAAGLQARAVLVWNAMQRWDCPADHIRTESGRVLHADGRSLGYAELAPAAELPGLLSALPTLAPPPSRIVGQPLARVDLVDKLAGRAVYGLDARSRTALVAVLLPPDRLGASLVDTGAEAARQVPGVVDVLALPGGSAPIAVLARDTWSALRGRAALQPRWAAPSSRYDSEATLRDFAGIARAGSAEAHVVRQLGAAPAARVEGRRIEALILSRHVTHAALEPINAQSTPAWLNQGADLVTSTQAPSLDMRRAARLLKRPPQVFEVRVAFVGGAFGRRVDNEVAGAAAWLAQQTKAPVQVLQFVGDDITNGQVRTLAAQHIEAVLDAQGRIVQWLHRTVGSATSARLFPERFAKEGFDQTLVDGQEHGYEIAYQRIESIHRPLPVACSYLRGVGAGFNVFGIETVVDEAAELAGAEPLAFRLGMLSDARARRVLQALGELPVPPRPGTADGIACMALRGSHVALRARVGRDATGGVRVERLQFVVDAGRIVNPELARCQVEGAALMGWSIAAGEALDFVDGRAVQRSLADYPLLRLPQLPPVDCRFIDAAQGEPRGIGEIALPLVAPAVANAWARLTGERRRALPFSRVSAAQRA